MNRTDACNGMSVAVGGNIINGPKTMGSDGGVVRASVKPSGTCEVKAVWDAILPDCAAYLVDGTPIAPEAPLGILTGRNEFDVLLHLPAGVPVEQQLKLGNLTFVGCTPNPGPGVNPCMGAGATVYGVVVGDTSVVIKDIVVETPTIKARTLTWVTITLYNPHPYTVTVSYYIPFGDPPRVAAAKGNRKEKPRTIEFAGIYLLRPGEAPIQPVHTEQQGLGSIDPLATQTIRLRIWHGRAGSELGSWDLAVRLYGVVDYLRTPHDSERVMTFVKSDELKPPVTVPVILEP
jgi:hypothetical protein